MNPLDEELKLALSEPSVADQDPSAAAVARDDKHIPRRAPGTRTGKRSWVFVACLAVMGAAILGIALTGIDNAAVYSKGVDQLLSERERLGSRNVRVVGSLVRGSLLRRNEPCEYRFRMRKGTAELSVHYPKCIIPDTFRDVANVDVEVTVEGRLQKDGTFLAHQLMAKCPSKYDMNNRKQSGVAKPHGAGAVLGDEPGAANSNDNTPEGQQR